MQGLVMSGSNNAFEVKCEDGLIRRCNIKGKVLAHDIKYYNPLAPGDVVEIEVDSISFNEALILRLVERKNFFPRLNNKTNTPQVLAANIDAVVCITTPDQPEFRPIFVDRVLVQASEQNIPVVIIVNKEDLGISKKVETVVNIWKSLNYTVLFLCAQKKQGLDAFLSLIDKKTICVMGQSGVGKSTLLNSIAPHLCLATSKVSSHTNKGSHTTTSSHLYEVALGNSFVNIIDTPGIKNFSLYNINKQNLALHFPEISDLLGTCKFGVSCSHITETGCKILESLECGRFSKQRYKSYLNMAKEL